jgi:hypothetical protein
VREPFFNEGVSTLSCGDANAQHVAVGKRVEADAVLKGFGEIELVRVKGRPPSRLRRYGAPTFAWLANRSSRAHWQA